MTKGDLRSVWLVPMSGGLGVQVNRRDRKPHFWRVRDMTDASFFRLQRTLDAMDALVRFDDDAINVEFYPSKKGTER